MKRICNFFLLGNLTFFVLVFSSLYSPKIFGQNNDIKNNEIELSVENPNSNSELFLNFEENGSKNNLEIKLFEQRLPLITSGSILNIQYGKDTLSFKQLNIENSYKTYLIPSTISHVKTYSNIVNVSLTNDEVLNIINSDHTVISLISKDLNKKWIVTNKNLEKIKLLFSERIKRDNEIQSEDLSVIELTRDDKNNYDVKNGVLLIKINPNSPLFNSGLEAGTVIMQINGIDIENVNQFKAVLKAQLNKASIFTIKSISGEVKFLNINIP